MEVSALPDEVLQHVFALLAHPRGSVWALAAARGVCRAWAKLAAADPLWELCFRLRFADVAADFVARAAAGGGVRALGVAGVSSWMEMCRRCFGAERALLSGAWTRVSAVELGGCADTLSLVDCAAGTAIVTSRHGDVRVVRIASGEALFRSEAPTHFAAGRNADVLRLVESNAIVFDTNDSNPAMLSLAHLDAEPVLLHTLGLPKGSVHVSAMTALDDVLAIGRQSGDVDVFDVVQNKSVASFKLPSPVASLALTPTTVFAAECTNTLAIYNIPTATLSTKDFPDEDVLDLELESNALFVVTKSALYRLDVATLEVTGKLALPTYMFRIFRHPLHASMMVHGDRQCAIAVPSDAKADLEITRKFLATPIYCVSVFKNLVALGSDTHLVVMEYSSGRELCKKELRQNGVGKPIVATSVMLSDFYVAVGYYDGMVEFFDLRL